MTVQRGTSAEEQITAYLREIGGVPLLTREGERDLARALEASAYIHAVQQRLSAASADAPSAHEVLVACYQRLDAVAARDGMSVEEIDRAVVEASILTNLLPTAGLTENDEDAYGHLLDVEDAADRARAALIEANLRLVVSVAKKYPTSRLPLSDLIQEGNIGLMHAVEKFEYRRGFKFSTYATWWIRQAIARAIENQARAIRIPPNALLLIKRMARVARRLEQDLGREVLDDELAAELGLSLQRLQDIRRSAQEPVSLDLPAGEDGEALLGDGIADAGAVNPLDLAAASQRSEQMQLVLDELEPREREVLRRRFGFDEGGLQTLETVAEALRISREQVRQIEVRALRRLRRTPVTRRWRDEAQD